MFNLYENIKCIAAEHGYSPSGLCDAMGKSRALLSNLKNGRAKTLSTGNFKLIADFLDEPLDRIMHGDIKNFSDNDNAEEKKPTTENDDELLGIDDVLVDMLMKLTPQETEKVVSFAQGLIAARKV